MVAQWYVMRAAKQAGLTVMLDGQGGDEMFGGYRAFVGFRLADLLAHGRLPRCLGAAGVLGRPLGAGAR